MPKSDIDDLSENARDIANAACLFARDHGPVSQALGGHNGSKLVVANRLLEQLHKHGLRIVREPSK